MPATEDIIARSATALGIEKEEMLRRMRLTIAAEDLYAALRPIVYAYAAQNDVEKDAQRDAGALCHGSSETRPHPAR